MSEHQRVTIVVADDDPLVREVVTEVLDDASDIDVIGQAGDADGAVAAARDHCPDVVLLDVKMPHGGGPDAARRIAEACPTARVVALSAYDDRGAILEMLHAGAVGYLVKGISTNQEIVATVRRAAKGEVSLPPTVGEKVLGELRTHLDRRTTRSRQQKAIETRVRDVLASGRIEVAFQPVLHLTSGHVRGYEAVPRFDAHRTAEQWWEDARQVDALLDLELAVARSALEHVSRVPDGSYLAISLSASTAVDGALQDLVLAAAPASTVLQISGHAPVGDHEAFRAAVEPVRAAGVRLAADDTGSGRGGLSHLLALQPDILRLDRPLTRGIEDDAQRRALTRALVSFAAEAGCDIVAAGIETQQELDALAHLGVGYAQGDAVGAPRPSPDA